MTNQKCAPTTIAEQVFEIHLNAESKQPVSQHSGDVSRIWMNFQSRFSNRRRFAAGNAACPAMNQETSKVEWRPGRSVVFRLQSQIVGIDREKLVIIACLFTLALQFPFSQGLRRCLVPDFPKGISTGLSKG